MKYSISKITKGQYSVKIDLKTCLDSAQIMKFERAMELIISVSGKRAEKAKIYKIKNGILEYRSETLLPLKNMHKKKKLLMVFGNPAVISIARGMFYFSNKNYHRHFMWKALKDARLMPDTCINDPELSLIERRLKEADIRRELILEGAASEKYLLGLTTFYSFPTTVIGPYANAAGAEKLFQPIIDQVHQMEIARIKSYAFTKNARLVFVQKSSYEAFSSKSGFNENRIIYWPAVSREKGARKKGSELKKMLEEKFPLTDK